MLIAFDHRFWTAIEALLPVIAVALVIAGTAILAFNGGIGGWILVDQIRPRRRARQTGRTVDELMDADEWARANGYGPPQLDETTEDWIFESPRFRTADPDRVEAVLFAASVMADIDDLPEASA